MSTRNEFGRVCAMLHPIAVKFPGAHLTVRAAGAMVAHYAKGARVRLILAYGAHVRTPGREVTR